MFKLKKTTKCWVNLRDLKFKRMPEDLVNSARCKIGPKGSELHIYLFHKEVSNNLCNILGFQGILKKLETSKWYFCSYSSWLERKSAKYWCSFLKKLNETKWRIRLTCDRINLFFEHCKGERHVSFFYIKHLFYVPYNNKQKNLILRNSPLNNNIFMLLLLFFIK